MDYLYLGSRSQRRTYRYTLPGISGMQTSTQYGGRKTWDIARDASGRIWAAVDDSDCSLCCFDASGTVVASVSRDPVSSARGVTVDDDGRIWASNDDDGNIYCIEPSE